MNNWKNVFIVTCLLLSTPVFFSSCEKDACATLKCKNSGSCANGLCNCPTGFDGAECENKISDRFVGVYIGKSYISTIPSFNDTIDVSIDYNPINLKLERRNSVTTLYYGRIENNTIVFDDYYNGSYSRKMSSMIVNNKMTLFIEENNNGIKQSTSFEGLK